MFENNTLAITSKHDSDVTVQVYTQLCKLYKNINIYSPHLEENIY